MFFFSFQFDLAVTLGSGVGPIRLHLFLFSNIFLNWPESFFLTFDVGRRVTNPIRFGIVFVKPDESSFEVKKIVHQFNFKKKNEKKTTVKPTGFQRNKRRWVEKGWKEKKKPGKRKLGNYRFISAPST